MEPSPFTPQERIESLKAGILSASVAILVHAALLTIPGVCGFWLPIDEGAELVGGYWIRWIGSVAIAAISGFLFGVTYRYAVRQDDNPQLKSGVVLAFGLVRGLAQADTGFGLTDSVVPLALMAIESGVMFGCDRIILDQALQRNWIKPFNALLPPA